MAQVSEHTNGSKTTEINKEILIKVNLLIVAGLSALGGTWGFGN